MLTPRQPPQPHQPIILKVMFPLSPLEGRRDSGCQKGQRNPGGSSWRVTHPPVQWACSHPASELTGPLSCSEAPTLRPPVQKDTLSQSGALVPGPGGKRNFTGRSHTGWFWARYKERFLKDPSREESARWQVGGRSPEACVPQMLLMHQEGRWSRW